MLSVAAFGDCALSFGFGVVKLDLDFADLSLQGELFGEEVLV